MPSEPDTFNSAASDPLFGEISDFLSDGIAVFDDSAELTQANAAFRGMNTGLADLLEPGLPWGIFLREAVMRGGMPEPVSHRLDALEAGHDNTDPVRMPGNGGQVYALRLSQTGDGGFVLIQTAEGTSSAANDMAREAEALLRKVLEACPNSLTMSRVTDGRVIYRSPAATELLGTVKSSFAHFAYAEERADFVTALLPDARVDNMRVTCLRADGQEFPADLSARLIDYRGEDVIVANIEDLTDELAVQAKLDRQKEQLFQSEKLSSLGELLAGVSHELNNPLSIILGNAEMLQEELEETPLQSRIDKLSLAAHRCVRIVRSFLSLARQEPLELRHLAPAVLIDTAVDAVHAEAEANGIRINVADGSSTPLIVADEVQFVQVIINLLTNAVHAIRDADQGDSISVHCEQDANMLRLTVRDNGPGVPEDIKIRIFDPLFTTKDVGKGTGVGLAYCHRIVVAHKGQIRLESVSGQGACFVIEIPVAES